MRLIWKTLGFLAVLLVLLIGGLFLLPADRLGKLAADQLSKQLGRPVSMGEARIAVWPVAGIEAANLTVANPGWAGADPMLTARAASFGLDPIAALRGKFAFRSIAIDGPTLRLTSDAQGRANWTFDTAPSVSGGQGGGAPGTATPAEITLDRLSITGATLILSGPGGTTRIENADLSLQWPDAAGPMQAEARLDKDGHPLRVTARIEAPRALLAGGAAPVAMTLGTPGGDIVFDGALGIAPEAQGRVRLDLSDTARAAAALGQVGLTLPEGLGRKVSGTLDLTLTRAGQLAIRDAALQLDDNRVTVAADITLAAKPRVNARIEAEALDLSGLSGGAAEGGGGSGSSSAAQGWSTAAIDASGLAAFDGEIGLVAGSVELGGMTFGATRALMTVENSRAVFDLRELRGYDGLLTGQFVANNRGGLSVRANLSFSDLALRPLLTDAMGIDRFSGPADGSVNLLGSGSSIAAIMASLSGDGSLRAGPGRIEGIDLEAALGGNASGGTTIFDAGTARNDDLALILPRLRARGEGRIDLGAQRLDYLFTVLDPQARGGRGLAIPVRLKGAWQAVSIRVDAGELIDQNLAEERDKLEQQARDKVNEAIEDRLGVKVEEGQSVEDALKQELEKRAVDGILDLLKR